MVEKGIVTESVQFHKTCILHFTASVRVRVLQLHQDTPDLACPPALATPDLACPSAVSKPILACPSTLSKPGLACQPASVQAWAANLIRLEPKACLSWCSLSSREGLARGSLLHKFWPCLASCFSNRCVFVFTISCTVKSTTTTLGMCLGMLLHSGDQVDFL